MNSLILYLAGNLVKALQWKDDGNVLTLNGEKFHRENVYFGDWIPIRAADEKIIGFKLIPLVPDDYLERKILADELVKAAKNVYVEKTPDTYISILLKDGIPHKSEGVNRIEAALFCSPNKKLAFCLEGLKEMDWLEMNFQF